MIKEYELDNYLTNCRFQLTKSFGYALRDMLFSVDRETTAPLDENYLWFNGIGWGACFTGLKEDMENG